MRIMATSDLHGNLDGLDPTGADVVVLAGDIAPLRGRGVWHINDQKKWINKRFREWTASYPDIQFVGGCPGNTKGVAKLVIGRKVEEVIALLKGIPCRNGTSCPDQLVRALEQARKA